MPAGYLSNPLMLIANTLIGAYIFILIIRVLLQSTGADSRNPISGFILKATQVPLRALNPIFPTIKNINLSAVALMIMMQIALGFLMTAGQLNANLWMIFIWSLTELISSVINVFTYSIFATVILSWVAPTSYNPGIALLYQITEPVLKPCRRMIPPMGGFDLSPMVALLGLQVLKMLLLPLFFGLM